jgi:FkbM family methyltransferase
LGGKVKRLIKLLMAQTPYRIIRDKGENRFQAIETCLHGMKARGFSPRIVIDGGAHLGSFSIAAQEIFPDARFHLVEPQAACSGSLRNLCTERGFIFHQSALAERVGQINLSETSEPSTGAHIKPEPDENTTLVAASTLDALFGWVTQSDRTLLKLDLQGYELHVLRGGPALLRCVEAILTEVSFFAQAYEPSIAGLISFLAGNDFQLYDIASLAGRSRDNRLIQGDFVFVRAGSQLLEDGRWE